MVPARPISAQWGLIDSNNGYSAGSTTELILYEYMDSTDTRPYSK